MQSVDGMKIMTTRLLSIASHAHQEIVPGQQWIKSWKLVEHGTFLWQCQMTYAFSNSNAALNSILKRNKSKTKLNIMLKSKNAFFFIRDSFNRYTLYTSGNHCIFRHLVIMAICSGLKFASEIYRPLGNLYFMNVHFVIVRLSNEGGAFLIQF